MNARVSSNHSTKHSIAAWLALLALASMMGACSSMDDEIRAIDEMQAREHARPCGFYAKEDECRRLDIDKFNYADYDIEEIQLVRPDANSMRGAIANGGGASATPKVIPKWSPTGWLSDGRREGGGMAMPWDYQWKTPMKLKVWWLRVVDPSGIGKAWRQHYNAYTSKNAYPGTAWCEGEITITRPPEKLEGDTPFSRLALYFYQDGRIEGDMELIPMEEFMKTHSIVHHPRVDIAKRYEQPTLTGRACLKEIPNPYYGLPEPEYRPHWN